MYCILYLHLPASTSVTGLEEDVAWVIKGGFTKEMILEFGLKAE